MVDTAKGFPHDPWHRIVNIRWPEEEGLILHFRIEPWANQVLGNPCIPPEGPPDEGPGTPSVDQYSTDVSLRYTMDRWVEAEQFTGPSKKASAAEGVNETWGNLSNPNILNISGVPPLPTVGFGEWEVGPGFNSLAHWPKGPPGVAISTHNQRFTFTEQSQSADYDPNYTADLTVIVELWTANWTSGIMCGSSEFEIRFYDQNQGPPPAIDNRIKVFEQALDFSGVRVLHPDGKFWSAVAARMPEIPTSASVTGVSVFLVEDESEEEEEPPP